MPNTEVPQQHFITEDGHQFHSQPDGTVTDSPKGIEYDMSWPSVAEFLVAMGDEGIGVTEAK
jgi:hypothetical protein